MLKCHRIRVLLFLLFPYAVISEPVPVEVPDALEPLPSFVFPEALNRVDFVFPVSETLSAEELLEQWRTAVSNPETDTVTWETLAIQHFIHEQFEQVIEARTAIGQRGDSPLLVERLAALSFEARQEWLQAYEAWEILYRRDPSDPTAGLRMVVCLLHLNEGTAALRFVRALSISLDDNATAWHLRGTLHWLNGEPRMAWRALARAASQADATADTALFLAWISTQENDLEEAIGWLRQALLGQSPAERLRTLDLPYFEPLRAEPSYAFMLDELKIPADRANGPDIETTRDGHARVTVEQPVADRTQLPESLRVSIRLQDYVVTDEEEEDPLDEPADATGSLRLRPEDRDAGDAEIIWHPFEQPKRP